MKRLIAFLLLSSFAFATTTVTGNMNTLGGSASSGGSFMRFWLRGCAGNQPRITGIAVVAPSQGGVYFFDIPANNGVVSGTLYSTRDATGNGNGEIECGGSYTSEWYGMQAFVNGKGGPEVPVAAKNSSTLDISTVTPITVNPVVIAPTGDTTYARLDGGNQPFTGSVSPSGNGTLNMGFANNRWIMFGSSVNISGNSTLTGNVTVGGTLNVTGVTTLGTLNATTISTTGNVSIGGTLGVTGLGTFTAGATGPFFNATTGYQVGGSYGTSGQCLTSTGSGSAIVNCPYYMGGTPSASVGAGAGGGASSSLTAGSKDHAGLVGVAFGSAPGAGTLTTVTFSTPFPTTSFCTISPANGAAAAIQVSAQVSVLTNNANNFIIQAGAAGSGSTTWAYHCDGY